MGNMYRVHVLQYKLIELVTFRTIIEVQDMLMQKQVQFFFTVDSHISFLLLDRAQQGFMKI